MQFQRLKTGRLAGGRVLVIILFAGLAACGRAPDGAVRPPATSAAPAASPSASPAPLELAPLPPAPAEIDLTRALQIDRYLAEQVGPRVAGSPEDDRATEYIQAQFSAAGYPAEKRPFDLAEGGKSTNVVARHPRVDYSNGYVIIGGHHDTVPGSPGANDNASGIAVIVTVAEKLFKYALPVEYAAFGAEERDAATRTHHEGSQAYASAMNNGSGPVKAMLSVDMIAAGPRLLLVRHGSSSQGKALQDELTAAAGPAGVPVVSQSRGDISDHVPFSRAKIPAVLVWTGDHPTKHKPTDTFGVVQRDAVGRAGRLVLEWLRVRHGTAVLN